MVDEPATRPRSSGLVLCGISALLLAIAASLAWSVLIDPAVAGDLDSGAHTAQTGGAGVVAVVLAVPGVVTALVALGRGALPAKLVAVVLVLVGIPLVPVSIFAALLSLG